MNKKSEKKEHKFIYTYSFIYDEEKKKELDEKNLKPVSYKDKFYIYFDKFNKEKVKKLDVFKYYYGKSESEYSKEKSNADFIITDFKNKFKFDIKNIFIYFFPNEIAILTVEVNISDYKNLEDLYYFNSMFVKVFSKENNDIYILKKDRVSTKTTKKESIEFCKNYKIEPKNNYYIFTPADIKNYYKKFSPYDDKFNDKYPQDRIGLIKDEKRLLENKSWEDLHYADFKTVKEEIEKPFRTIHYDTFFLSLFVKFAKINTKIEYYDNFNPLDVNYLHLYTAFCEDNLQEEYNENFAKYEPFLHNKKIKGEIIKADFFDIYQTQADWFIIGNEQNLVNVLKKETYDHVNSLIKNQRFLLYLFVSFQNVFLTMAENKLIFSNTDSFWKKVNFIVDSMDEYVEYLSNYNFVDISDEPSINSYYKFLQKNKYIHNKLDALKALSGFHRSFKNITQNLISKKWLIVWIVLTPIIFKAINEIYKIVWNLLGGFCSSNQFWCSSLGILVVVLTIIYMFFEKDKDR